MKEKMIEVLVRTLRQLPAEDIRKVLTVANTLLESREGSRG